MVEGVSPLPAEFHTLLAESSVDRRFDAVLLGRRPRVHRDEVGVDRPREVGQDVFGAALADDEFRTPLAERLAQSRE